MDWSLFLSSFTLVFLAELPDKTALATVMMSARGRKGAIFLGAAAAFVVQTLVAVAFGGLIGAIPSRWVHLAAGVAFLVFAALLWGGGKPRLKSGARSHARMPREFERMTVSGSFPGEAVKAFGVIFIAEWGDLTQWTSASLVARTHQPVTIFTASVLALWAVAALAITVGQSLGRWIRPRVLERTGAVIFILVGFYFMASWVRSG